MRFEVTHATLVPPPSPTNSPNPLSRRSMLHSRVLGEQTQLKEEMEALRRDNAQLVREHNHLKQSCEELKRLHGQDQKELADLRLQQQQVPLKARAHTHEHRHRHRRGNALEHV